MRAGRLVLASLAALAWAQAAAAQPAAEPTNITPDAASPLSLGTTTTRAGNVTTIDGGTRAGPNLFHSFSRFDLGRGDLARWVHSAGNPTTIANVINRVTGGDPSNISGEIDSNAIPNADFWFINPAGVLFGQGARVDVPAAAHFTTAQELRFAAGPNFTVATPGGSTFSVAAPAAFGFLGGQGSVSVGSVTPSFLPGAGRLTLTGRHVTVDGSTFAGSGFGLAAVGSGAATISTATPRAGIGGGSTAIVNSVLRSTGNDGILVSGEFVSVLESDLGTAFVAGPLAGISGPIDIFGRQVTIFSSLVSASTFGSENAGEIRIAGDRVTISGTMVLSETERGSTGEAGSISISGGVIEIFDRSLVSSSTLSEVRGGDIVVRGDRIIIDRAVVAAGVLPDATGSAGMIDIAGRVLELTDTGTISSESAGFGDAGAIFIQMSEAVALNRGFIDSRSVGQGGAAGLVSIAAPSVSLLDRSAISTSTRTSGAAGIIGIGSDDIVLAEESRIETVASQGSSGDAGLILIRSLSDQGRGRLLLTGSASLRSDTSGSGDAGGVFIEIADVELRDGAIISSDAGFGCTEILCGEIGSAGGIGIVADRLLLVGNDSPGFPTRISSDSFAGGDAGAVGVQVGDLTMIGFTQISSDTYGAGLGGEISIAANTIGLDGGATLSTSTLGSGRGGSITITAADLQLSNESRISSTALLGSTGNAGTIAILGSGDGPSRLLIDSDSAIRADTAGSGSGGTVRIETNDIVLRGGGEIASDSGRACSESGCGPLGPAGNIEITARSLLLQEPETPGSGTVITSGGFGGGDAGTIRIRLSGDLDLVGQVAPRVLARGAFISSSATQSGRGGLIDVAARNIRMSGSFSGFAASTFGSGDGGIIRLEASESIVIEEEAGVESTTGDGRTWGNAPPGQGDGGEIFLVARDIVLRSGGGVGAETYTDGDAGAITVRANRLHMDGLSSIRSSTFATGRAGSIDIAVGDLIMEGFASIDSDAVIDCVGSDCLPGGAAGNIVINADRLIMTARPSRFEGVDRPIISTDTATGGDAGGLEITVVGEAALTGAEISSSTRGGGNAGTILLNAGNLELRESATIATNSGASGTATPIGNAGEINIQAGSILIDEGEVLSTASSSTGRSGVVTIGTDELLLLNGSIRTNSLNENEAGGILIQAPRVTLMGDRAAIASANNFDGVGNAGAILVSVDQLSLFGGARLNTSSDNGAAGSIGIFMPQTGLLRLESAGTPSLITTSSGPGTGGRIFISHPLAIISNGGQILALGQEGGANVQIFTDFFIRSSDRFNRVAVDGNFLLDATAGDVSSGTTNRDLSVIDASGVLRGQCASARASGQVSQLVVRPIGPYGNRPAPAGPMAAGQAEPTGTCF